MILYNASISTGIRNFARRFSNSNTANYSNADLDASVNAYYDLFVGEILKSMDDWDFQGEVATASLVANQQEYVFPSDILRIKRIEVTYDGTNWKYIDRFDINDRTEATDTTSIANDFTSNEPKADIHDNSIFLYPIPSSNVTNGLKIWYEKNPTVLTNATDEPVFARPYHIGLAYGAAKDWLEQYPSKENVTRLTTATTNLEKTIARMKEFYQKKNQDRDYIVTPGYVEYDYGNY
jgi:hypothetical protein